jgi:hypothetical protein
MIRCCTHSYQHYLHHLSRTSIAQTTQSWYTSNSIPKLCDGNTDSISVLLRNEKKTRTIPTIRTSILLQSKGIEIRKKKPDRKSSKSQTIKMTYKSAPNPKRISSKDHCKRTSCRKRGTHKNHTHDECRFKESDSATKHPNLGNAPAKKQRNAKINSSQPAKNAFTPPVKSDERKCYTCGKPGRLSNACPDKGRIKAGAQNSLNKNKTFMALWQSSFADAAQQQCATRFLKSWGDDVRSTCLGELSFDHRCDPNDIAIAQHASSVRDTLRSTPLLQTIQSAHVFERTGTEKLAPISMGPSFFHDAEGQGDSENDDDENETARSGDESQDSNRDEQHNDSDSDSSASNDSYRSRNSSDTDKSNDSD